jgi:hypothetical protein
VIVQRAYRTELDPTNAQRTAFLRHAGCARFAYNWGLQRKEETWWMNQLPGPHIKPPHRHRPAPRTQPEKAEGPRMDVRVIEVHSPGSPA